jgi:hypothetical protein
MIIKNSQGQYINKDYYLNFSTLLITRYYDNIKSSQNKINNILKELNKVSRYNKLNEFIQWYFQYIDKCIEQKNDIDLCPILNLDRNTLAREKNNKLKEILNNKDTLKNNLDNIIHNNIIKNSNSIDELNYISKVCKLYLLYNNNNNNNKINDYFVLINNYFTFMKIVLMIYKNINLEYYNFIDLNNDFIGGEDNDSLIIDKKNNETIRDILFQIMYFYTRKSIPQTININIDDTNITLTKGIGKPEFNDTTKQLLTILNDKFRKYFKYLKNNNLLDIDVLTLYISSLQFQDPIHEPIYNM